MHASRILQSAISILTLSTQFQLTIASPLDLVNDLVESTLEKRCANSCGYYGQICCASGEKCSTDDNGQAVCVTGSSNDGSWEYYTTTYVVTETDTSTRTSTWSSYKAKSTGSGGGSKSCKSELGETLCGNTCCGAAYVCSKDQCIMGSSSIWATATATPPVRGTSASTVTATASATTTQGFDAPVGTDGASLVGVKAPDEDNGLSGGAIAGIVIGTIAGVFLLLLLAACLCCRGALEGLFACLGIGKRKRKETTYVDERYSHHHSHGGRPEGRTWFGTRPSAPAPPGEKKSRFGGLATMGIILGAIALCLGLKRRKDQDEKSDYTYPSSYYTYSDYTSASSESSDRRTRDTRRSRRSRARSRRS